MCHPSWRGNAKNCVTNLHSLGGSQSCALAIRMDNIKKIHKGEN